MSECFFCIILTDSEKKKNHIYFYNKPGNKWGVTSYGLAAEIIKYWWVKINGKKRKGQAQSIKNGRSY